MMVECKIFEKGSEMLRSRQERKIQEQYGEAYICVLRGQWDEKKANKWQI